MQNGVRGNIKKFEAIIILTNKTDRGQKCKISKFLKRKLVQTANKNLKITAATTVSDAANS